MRTREVLYVLPHPDDELFCAGLLRVFRKEDARQTILWLSCGGPFEILRKWEVRRSKSMMNRANVRVLRAAFPDGRFATCVESLAASIERAIDEVEPDTIVTTAWEGGHPDHDTVGLICGYMSSRNHRIRHVVFVPTYRRQGSRIVVGRVNHLGREHSQRLRLGHHLALDRMRVALRYPSQLVVLLPLLALGGWHFLFEQEMAIGCHSFDPTPPDLPTLYQTHAQLLRKVGLRVGMLPPEILRERVCSASRRCSPT